MINKTKSYKNDNLCKSKALAWLSLIENIDNKVPSYLANVVIPFFNYCFGLNCDSLTNEYEANGNKTDNLTKFLQSRRSIQPIQASPTTSVFSEALFKIGIEFYILFLCNGAKDTIPEDIAKNLKNGKIRAIKFKKIQINSIIKKFSQFKL